MQRIENEIDFVQFVKQQIFVKVMLEALFNKRERFLISKNRRFALGKAILSDDSLSKSEQELDLTK